MKKIFFLFSLIFITSIVALWFLPLTTAYSATSAVSVKIWKCVSGKDCYGGVCYQDYAYCPKSNYCVDSAKCFTEGTNLMVNGIKSTCKGSVWFPSSNIATKDCSGKKVLVCCPAGKNYVKNGQCVSSCLEPQIAL